MTITNQQVIVIFGVALITASHAVADERIWLREAEVNNNPVKLVFDTGSPYNFLSPDALKRLGLKFIRADTTNELTPGIWAGDTEPCAVSFNGTQSKTTFVVLDLPRYL